MCTVATQNTQVLNASSFCSVMAPVINHHSKHFVSAIFGADDEFMRPSVHLFNETIKDGVLKLRQQENDPKTKIRLSALENFHTIHARSADPAELFYGSRNIEDVLSVNGDAVFSG
jgi:hypothetical protein